jgi:hypothetical protein
MAAAAAAAVLAAQAATAAEDIAVDAVFEYCGFILPQHRAAIRADGFNSSKDLMKFNQKDIESLATGFEAKTVQPGRLILACAEAPNQPSQGKCQLGSRLSTLQTQHRTRPHSNRSSQHQRRWTRGKTERGRIDSKALQVHNGGEGSKSVRIKETKV